MPQIFVVVEILVSQCYAIHPLGDHLLNRMIDSFLIPTIHETRGETRQQIHSPIRLSQQQTSGVGSLLTTVESGRQLSGKMSFELEALDA
jgi:hypothetical protein